MSLSSYDQALAWQQNGSADAAISNHLFGDYFYQKYGLTKTTIDFDPAELFYATAQGQNSDLLQAIDRDLGKVDSGTKSPYYTTLGNWTTKGTNPECRSMFYGCGGISGLLVDGCRHHLAPSPAGEGRTKHLEHANAELQEAKNAIKRSPGSRRWGSFAPIQMARPRMSTRSGAPSRGCLPTKRWETDGLRRSTRMTGKDSARVGASQPNFTKRLFRIIVSCARMERWPG